MSMEGKFIVIEGIDRSGKSTLLNEVVTRLRRKYPTYKFKDIHFPDRTTETGKILDKYLKKEIDLGKEASHLLFSANRWEKNQEIIESIQSQFVISARYYFSGIAYSRAALGLDNDWVEWHDKGLVEPDLLLFLDVSAKITSERENFGVEVYDNSKTQEKVYKELKNVCTAYKNCKVIDGSEDFDVIVQNVIKYVEELY